MFAGCPAEVVDTMREYGERLGVAFQLANDLIDIESRGRGDGQDPLAPTFARASAPSRSSTCSPPTDPADARLRELLGGDLEGRRQA